MNRDRVKFMARSGKLVLKAMARYETEKKKTLEYSLAIEQNDHHPRVYRTKTQFPPFLL